MKFVSALCIACWPLVAAPQASEGEHEGIRYLSGGADEPARTAMRREADEFSLRLQFAAGDDGRYVSDVQVMVSDLDGERVLALPRTGPLLYLDLPTGRYVVQARLGDSVLTRGVAVGERPGRIAQFHWPED
jgi:hypothetical protein